VRPAGGWTNGFLDTMRMTADPVADRVMDAVFAQHGIERVNQLLAEMGRSTTLVAPDDIATLIHGYLDATRTLPSWTEPARIQAAEALFYEHGLTSVVALFYSSLPFCYVMRNEADVLQLAGQLREHTERRIRETARMIFPVMDAGGMAPGGSGIPAVQKVRLIHAAIRHLILHRDAAQNLTPGLGHQLATAKWDVAAQGLPINQEQLAYTLLTFGFTFVTSSRKLGVPISRDQALAYLHIWNVTGHLLGLREDMMAGSWEDAEELFGILQERGMEATENGRMLGAALVAVQQSHIPWRWLKPAGPIITRYLVGSRTANMLGIRHQGSFPVHLFLTLLLHVARMADRIVRTVDRDFSIVQTLSHAIARQIVQPLLEHQTRPLVIRDELLDRWNLGPARMRIR
jgi:hypothetical protein